MDTVDDAVGGAILRSLPTKKLFGRNFAGVVSYGCAAGMVGPQLLVLDTVPCIVCEDIDGKDAER